MSYLWWLAIFPSVYTVCIVMISPIFSSMYKVVAHECTVTTTILAIKTVIYTF